MIKKSCHEKYIYRTALIWLWGEEWKLTQHYRPILQYLSSTVIFKYPYDEMQDKKKIYTGA